MTNEPMMAKHVNAIVYSDPDESHGYFVDDEWSELEVQGVKYEDVFDPGGLSTWHDG